MRAVPYLAVGLILGLGLASNPARGEDEFERAPIHYSQGSPANVVATLMERLKQGDVKLDYDAATGYLPAVLRALDIPVESQTLVFSKTSLQRSRIAPRSPRAIYFNDEVYVGYCRDGEVMEVSVADPQLGTVFYTLEQKQAATPKLLRQTENCLICHSTTVNVQIPGHLLRSVFTDASGLPLLAEGSHRVDHTTPIADRWGGWYVTGKHGEQKHLGNFLAKKSPIARPIDNSAGHNVTDVSDRFSTAGYLTAHSDIVALMVLEHQTLVHNLITQANFATRQALDYEATFNKILGEEAGERLESTERRIANAGEKLVKGLLFAEEAPLTDEMVGTSGFAEIFAKRGPHDKQGRSLREFDLKKRIFKYPCSYLIYTAAFDGLPDEMKRFVADRLRSILTDFDGDKLNADYRHLSQQDRQAIWQILQATKPELFKAHSR